MRIAPLIAAATFACGALLSSTPSDAAIVELPGTGRFASFGGNDTPVTSDGPYLVSLASGLATVSQTSDIESGLGLVFFTGGATDRSTNSFPESSLTFVFNVTTPTAYTFDVTAYNFTGAGASGSAVLQPFPGGVPGTPIFQGLGSSSGTLAPGEYRLIGDATVQSGTGSADVSFEFLAPEPACLATLALGGLMFLTRRRRNT